MTMSIKPDHWIRRMAQEHAMIEPFEERQVSQGTISYGLSSFGYDIRVADEFRIFTAATGRLTVVDPKAIDESAMAPYRGDVCIIPPNSFALARTVEYFRVPRNVICLCVGKSTYARCFRGDTRVALVDGATPTLEEMARRADTGESFWGYSIGQFGRVMVTLLEAPRYVGRDSLLEVVLDNGATIHCTPDHQFIMRDGRMIEAGNLRPDDSLMPLYRHLARGYEMVYQPSNRHLYPTHRLADEWNVRHGLYADQVDTHRHHVDFNRRNNNPWNIERVNSQEHIRLHNQVNYGEEFDPDEHSAAIREALSRLKQDPAWRDNYTQVQHQRAWNFWNDEKYARARDELREKHRANWTEQRRLAQSHAQQAYYSDPANRSRAAERSRQAWANDDGSRREMQREIGRSLWLRGDITAEKVRRALDETGSLRGAARLLECDRSVFRRFPEIVAAFRGRGDRQNHKVQTIATLPGDHDVYCLTVPEAGNFALEAGVFVSNCGIIVNLTPFEPAWEGYVTLEISNTTPLPAKIYANEGIAQVLFFEGEEPEISYADRHGKYQGQRGITLPRMKQ